MSLKDEFKDLGNAFFNELKNEMKNIFKININDNDKSVNEYINANTTDKILKSIYQVNKIYIKVNDKKIYPTLVNSKEYEFYDKLVILVPKGLSYKVFIKNKEVFETALKGKIKIEWEYDKIYMTIYKKKLKTYIKYTDEVILEIQKQLVIPIGKSHEGWITHDFSKALMAHLLVGGITGSGKSTFLRFILYCLNKVYESHQLNVYVSDLKDGGKEALNFTGLDIVKNVSVDKFTTQQMLLKIKKEVKKRGELLAELNKDNLYQAKFQNLCKNVPYVILIIDEFQVLDDLDILEYLLSQARFTGVHLILGTQRPSADILPGILKANLSTTLAFRVRNDTNSRILLDNTKAAELPNIPGRAIYQSDNEIEIQVPNVSVYQLPKRDYNKLIKIDQEIEEQKTKNKNNKNKDFGKVYKNVNS